jgi:putative acetyltransferase
MAGLASLLHQAVHEGAAGCYDAAQRRAWSPRVRSAEAMADRLEGQICIVAEDPRGLAGFFTLTKKGTIDLAYVRPDRMGDGLAGQIYARILQEARRLDLLRLRVEASELARRFFAKRGWQLVRTQAVCRSGVRITNHVMELQLART